MKKLFALLLIFFSVTASAEWVKIDRATNTASEKFIDPKSVRQTGPMNTMRRVWELSNLSKRAPNNAMSIKSLNEYDCKDRRIRVIKESYFSEHGAEGETLAAIAQDAKASDWSEIVKGSIGETIFNRVCPSDGT